MAEAPPPPPPLPSSASSGPGNSALIPTPDPLKPKHTAKLFEGKAPELSSLALPTSTEPNNFMLIPRHDPLAPKAVNKLFGSGEAPRLEDLAPPEDPLARTAKHFPKMYGPNQVPTQRQQRQADLETRVHECTTYTSGGSAKTAVQSSAYGGSDYEAKIKAAGERVIEAHKADNTPIGAARDGLMQHKEFLLSNFCSSGQVPGSPDAHRVMGMVSEINRQLGLPPGDTGSWKVPF